MGGKWNDDRKLLLSRNDKTVFLNRDGKWNGKWNKNFICKRNEWKMEPGILTITICCVSLSFVLIFFLAKK